MRRLCKENNSKHGFTLTEMIIVVGIIVIIASVVGVGVADLIKTSNKSNDAVADSANSVRSNIHASELMLSKYNFG